MPISAGELAQIVWAETGDLGVADADGSGDINKVRRLLAQLAASASGVGFNKRRSVPLTTDNFYGGTATAIMKIADDAKDLTAPQSHLIIWDAGPDQSKLNPATKPPPPEPWASVNPNTITNQLHYTLPSGRAVDVFSRAVPPGADASAPLVNALTGTGVPSGKVAAAASDTTAQSPHNRVAWLLGIAGVLLFIIGGAMAALSGLSAAGARNLLVTSDPSGQNALLLHAADLCRTDSQSFSLLKLDTSGVCEDIKDATLAGQVLATARNCVQDAKTNKVISPDCNTMWRAAVAADQDEFWKKSYFAWTYGASAYLTGIKAEAGSSSIVFPFLVTVVGIVGLIAALGLGTKGRPAGVWIDTRNRVSLARAQVTLWTVVAISGYLILAMFNVGFADFLPSPQSLADYVAFPKIPSSIIAALGIATGSTMLSPLILNTKQDKDPDPDFENPNPGTAFFGKDTSGLDANVSPDLASFADLFMGEENANAGTVDVSRLQNVMITITLVLGFFYFLLEEMSNIKTVALLSANGGIFDSLPPVGGTFACLLAASHATYLVAKSHDKQSTPQTGANTAK